MCHFKYIYAPFRGQIQCAQTLVLGYKYKSIIHFQCYCPEKQYTIVGHVVTLYGVQTAIKQPIINLLAVKQVGNAKAWKYQTNVLVNRNCN